MWTSVYSCLDACVCVCVCTFVLKISGSEHCWKKIALFIHVSVVFLFLNICKCVLKTTGFVHFIVHNTPALLLNLLRLGMLACHYDTDSDLPPELGRKLLLQLNKCDNPQSKKVKLARSYQPRPRPAFPLS